MTHMASAQKITPEQFFSAWRHVCEIRKSRLLNEWTVFPNYTAEIFDVDGAVIKAIAKELMLDVYGSYYSIDPFLLTKKRTVCIALLKSKTGFKIFGSRSNMRTFFEADCFKK